MSASSIAAIAPVVPSIGSEGPAATRGPRGAAFGDVLHEAVVDARGNERVATELAAQAAGPALEVAEGAVGEGGRFGDAGDLRLEQLFGAADAGADRAFGEVEDYSNPPISHRAHL